MDIWDEIFYAVLDNDDVDSSSYTSSNATSQPVASEFVRNLFMSAAKDTALPDLLTVIVKTDWSVPIDSQSILQCLDAKPGEYRLMLEVEPKTKGKGKNKKAGQQSPRQKVGGHGGKLVPLHAVQSSYAQKSPDDSSDVAKVLSGREIIRTIPADVDGLLVHLDEEAPFEITSEYFALMRTIADECDLEDLIVFPQPGQVDKLLQAKWWVEVEEDQVVAKQILDERRVVYARVREDRLGLSFSRFKQMTGEQLFRAVMRIQDAHGLVIDELLGSPDNQFYTPLFSLECIEKLLEGNDTRVGVEPLPARSLEEIELWLQLRRFPSQNRRVLDASHDGQTLIRVMVPDGANWTVMECLGNQCFRKPVWSPVFSLPSPEAKRVSGFGDGHSKILCPGLLARELNAGAFQNGANAEKYWKVGRNLLFGRLLDRVDIEMSEKRLKIARELQKLIPQGMNTIPRSRMRSVEGAAFVEEHPHGATRSWIEETVKQAERFTKTWVPN